MESFLLYLFVIIVARLETTSQKQEFLPVLFTTRSSAPGKEPDPLLCAVNIYSMNLDYKSY